MTNRLIETGDNGEKINSEPPLVQSWSCSPETAAIINNWNDNVDRVSITSSTGTETTILEIESPPINWNASKVRRSGIPKDYNVCSFEIIDNNGDLRYKTIVKKKSKVVANINEFSFKIKNKPFWARKIDSINNGETTLELSYFSETGIVSQSYKTYSSKNECETELEQLKQFGDLSTFKLINNWIFKENENKLFWARKINSNNGETTLELSYFSETGIVSQSYKTYNSENECETALNLNEELFFSTFFKPINNEKFYLKILNSKSLFILAIISLNLSQGSLELFNAKNNLHKEKELFKNLFTSLSDVKIATLSGFISLNLSLANFEIITSKLNLENKFLLFLSFLTIISGWQQYLDLYVGGQDIELINFIKGTALNFIVFLITDLVFDKIVFPMVNKLLSDLKNKNILRSIGLSTGISSLIFCLTVIDIVRGLFGEEKKVNLETISEPLLLGSITTVIEHFHYGSYFVCGNLFLPKISSGIKWCLNKFKAAISNENKHVLMNDDSDDIETSRDSVSIISNNISHSNELAALQNFANTQAYLENKELWTDIFTKCSVDQTTTASQESTSSFPAISEINKSEPIMPSKPSKSNTIGINNFFRA